MDEKDKFDVNKKNAEAYQNLMNESSTKLDGYWDSNNSFVRLLLIALAIFIVVGILMLFVF